MTIISAEREPRLALLRGLSSAGRAPALHAGGQRFEPASLHRTNERTSYPFGAYR